MRTHEHSSEVQISPQISQIIALDRTTLDSAGYFSVSPSAPSICTKVPSSPSSNDLSIRSKAAPAHSAIPPRVIRPRFSTVTRPSEDMLKYRHIYTCVEVSGIPVEGARGIYRLILGTFPIIGPARRGGNVFETANSEDLRRAMRLAGTGKEVLDLGREPARSLRNHGRISSRTCGGSRPKMLGHDGHPAGLSNGKAPAFPAPDKA